MKSLGSEIYNHLNMKIHPLILAVLLICLSYPALALGTHSQAPSAIQPLIVEYISNYSVGVSDVSDLVDNQFSRIEIGQVKTSYVTMRNVTISTSYRGSNRTVDDADPLRVRVSNDSIGLYCSFVADVRHTIGSKTYSCGTSIIDLPLSYTKEFDLETGNIIIDSVSKNYSFASFTKAECQGKIDSADTDRIKEAIIGVEGSSVYLELKKVFDKTQTFLQDNARNEHLSKIYATNPYLYDYYKFPVSINVSTLRADRYNHSGIVNAMSGAIAGTTHLAPTTPAPRDNFHSFYSMAFMQNMLEYGRANYKNWTNIVLNGKNMRNRVFRYRLMDLEVLVPQVLKDYPKQYLAPLTFTCSIFEIGASDITDKLWNQVIRWNCKGSFETVPGQTVTVLDFIADIQHGMEIRVSGSRLDVLVQKVDLVGLSFDFIGNYIVEDLSTAATYIKEGLFEFRTYTFGSFFRIKEGSYNVELEPGAGVWIG